MASRVPSFKLNNGLSLPGVGLGVWMGKPGPTDPNGRSVEDAIHHALSAGYRHIDTAALYQDEQQVGDAIRASNVDRKDVWVTTKLSSFDRRDSQSALKDSLSKLNIGYIDAYLMHWPQGVDQDSGEVYGLPDQQGKGPTFQETWAEMEEMLQKGTVKTIGVSNFDITNLKMLLETAKVTPAINQVEGHPYNPDPELAAFCEQHGIHITYYSPLGQPQNRTDIVADEELNAIGHELSCSAGQVALAWALAKGHSVVPKSSRPERIKSNIDLPNLSSAHVDRIDQIHVKDPKKHTRLNIAATNAEKKTVFGLTLEQLGWDIGFLPIGMPGKANKVAQIA